MMLIRCIFLYIILLSPSIFIADMFNKKIENTIPLGLISITILMYIFGLANLLSIGIILTSIISILLLIYTIIKNIKNQTIKELKEKLFTKGSIFFTIIFFVFIIVAWNRELTHWDQFSYWSLDCKDMFNTNKLILTVESTVKYPPVPAVLQYFSMKIMGEYIQGIEIFVTWIFGFSFFLPLFKESNGKKLSNIMISIIIICIPAVFKMLIFYESSYPDALLGIIIGYVSYIYFFEEKSNFKIFNIILTLMLLTITKPTGFIIAIILLITFGLFDILTKKVNVKTLFIFLLAIIVTYSSWSIYIKFYNESPTININKVIQSLHTTIFGVYQEDNDAANSNGKLLEKLENVTEISTPVQINALGVITIYVCISLIYYYKSQNKKYSKSIIISVFTGLILYILALQLAYITQFSTEEMLAHDGMERYIATYLLGILYFIVAVCLNIFKDKKNNFLYVILASIIIMITPLSSVANATITSGIYNINTSAYCNIGRQRAEKILNEVGQNEKVLGICQNPNIRLINLMVKYYMYPSNYKVVDKIDASNSIESILQQDNFDYIYVISTDKYLDKKLDELFNIQNVEKNGLYKINYRKD